MESYLAGAGLILITNGAPPDDPRFAGNPTIHET
jgi:hypothetical protein